MPWSEPFVCRCIHFLRHSLPTLVTAGLTFPRYRQNADASYPRILVTRIDGIGDFVILAPFLRELRRKFPNSHITLVVGRNAGELALPCPYVDEVFTVDPAPKPTSFASYRKYLTSLFGYLRYLITFSKQNLEGRIDLAIQPRWDVDLQWATLITFLSGAPRRIGYSEKTSMMKSWCNWGYDRLFTEVLPPGPDQHEVERNLDVIRYFGGTPGAAAAELWWRREDNLSTQRFMIENGLSESKPIFAFGVGAAKGWSRWPFYGELISHLLAEWDFTPLIVAGPGEEAVVEEIRDHVPSAIVTALPLGAVAALLARCTLFVGNNSGPIHLASAVGLPLIEISAHPRSGIRSHENDPERFGALAKWKSVVRPAQLTGDCHGSCMTPNPHCIATITPTDVATEVSEMARALELRITI